MFIIISDAIANINFKTTKVISGTSIDGTIYAAFLASTSGSGSYYCAIKSRNIVVVVKAGSYENAEYAYVIYS